LVAVVRFTLAVTTLQGLAAEGLLMIAASCACAARASVLVALVALPTRPLAAQGATDVPPVTATGCVVQSDNTVAAPPTGHEQGAAKGLTLTRATITTRDARSGGLSRSAVPGSRPSGSGTGTTDGAAARTPVPVEQSFWLVGAKAAELLRFVGRRAEITGAIDERLAANPGNRAITDAGAAASRAAVTARPEPPATAHPSAPTRAISVTAFRVLDGACS
jgi:hypothetical protein